MTRPGVLITARDEAETLPGALESVLGWAAEVLVVVDPRSTDATRELASGAGARVLDHPFQSSGVQCNWGLNQGRHDWVLVLDADERVTAGLRREIDALPESPRAAAYSVARHNYAFGQRLRFGDWGGDRVVRLLDRRQARYAARAVHSAVEAPSVGRLQGFIEHHTLRSLAQYLPKLDDYAWRGAADLQAMRMRATPVHAAAHAAWRFWRGYLLRGGVLDGRPGLVVAVLDAWGTYLKWMRAWEATTVVTRRP